MPRPRLENALLSQDAFDEALRSFAEPLLNGFRSRLPATSQTRSFPAVNEWETEQSCDVSVESPGMDAKDIQIEVLGNQSHISGERKWEEEKKGKELHCVESEYGSFSRSLALPESLKLDRESIEATFLKGVLEIKIPKADPTLVAKIAIEAK